MTISSDSEALARAVLAGDEAAIAGLVDCVLETTYTHRPSREWLDLWDTAAREFAAVMMRLPGEDSMWSDYREGGQWADLRAQSSDSDVSPIFAATKAYNWADALMAERMKRLKERVREKKK